MKSVRLKTVKAGDRLPRVAAEFYGDPRLWRLIAQANAIDDPLAFPGPGDLGRLLLIPDR